MSGDALMVMTFSPNRAESASSMRPIPPGLDELFVENLVIQTLRSSALRIVASDDEGVIRAVELEGHPFFVGTLFLPQLGSTAATPHPLVTEFLRASLAQAPSVG